MFSTFWSTRLEKTFLDNYMKIREGGMPPESPVARREGLNNYYRLSNSKIIKACDLMRQVLLENLETGATLVEAARA